MKILSIIAFALSVIALILSALVSVMKIELWLAGTQWMLVSILFAAYAIIAKGCGCDCCQEKKNEQ